MDNLRSLVICTCSLCAKNSIVTNSFGQRQPGKWMPKSTRADHRTRDTRLSTPRIPTAQTQPSLPSQQVPSSHLHSPAAATPIDSNPGGEEDPLETETNSVGALKKSLFTSVCTLAAWLHLVCGLSRASTSQTLKVLGFIIQLAINLGSLLSFLKSGANTNHSFPSPHLPQDVRTAMSALSIEPNIIRSICCPKCLKQYNLGSLPEICDFRETKRSKLCGEQLWTIRSTRRGPRRVPCRLYSTQDFESWLEFFLSQPGIEDIIDKSYIHMPSPHNMRSILDSPAWKSLGDGTFSSTPGNLTFSYYIDWFNPYTNKTSGKSATCGAIMMFCLNLPFDIQHLPENTYFAGITPPPREPTITTITAVADPIIDRLASFWDGRFIKTHRHPRGILMRVALLARIGDLTAMRKALGFAGVTAHQFCSFCKLLHAQLDDLNYESWEMRNGAEVLAAATEWKNATTKVKRREIFKEHGVRWSSLHQLPYGDPVCHTMLGVMHNWIEGILQHHVRVRWGIGIPPPKKNESEVTKSTDGDSPLDHLETASMSTQSHPLRALASFHILPDEDILDEEVEAMFEESRMYKDSPSHIARMHSEASMLSFEELAEGSDEEDTDFHPDSGSDSGSLDSDSEHSDDLKDDHSWETACVFTRDELSRIRDCLADAVVPSWVERPPVNLGEKSHGKLKADQWFVLFSVFLPLIVPEIWSAHSSRKYPHYHNLLNNFYNLVTCTNIVCAYSVTPDSPGAYLHHYVEYQKSARTLFPNTGTRPNHHYAMHNADLMMFWGPLIRLSEFAGERHNGRLQKIQTNNHLWQLDFTMLRQMCRRGRLMSFLRRSNSTSVASNDSNSTMIQTGMHIFLKGPTQKEDPGGTGLKLLPSTEYSIILDYINTVAKLSNPPVLPFRHAQHMPHPENEQVLPRSATPIRHFKLKGRDYSTFGMHPGNSSIFFSGKLSGPNSGHIESIWRFKGLSDAGVTRTFIFLSPHRALSSRDTQFDPYQSRPGYLAKIVYARNSSNLSLMLIEPEDIIAHVAYYPRPSGTFGISQATSVVINSLHRYQD